MLLATLLAPTALALIYYLLPPTKSDLIAVKTEAASNLEVVKTANRVELDAIKSDVSNLRTDVKEIGRDIKDLLQRTPVREPDARQVVFEDQPPQAPVKKIASSVPPSPPPSHKKPKVAAKKEPALWPWSTR